MTRPKRCIVQQLSLIHICFFGMLIANVCGCAVAVPILLCTAGLALAQILTICGLYLASSCVGVLLALILLLRFDALELLTKID